MYLNLIGSSNPNKVHLILGLPVGAACAGLWAPECRQQEHQLPSFLSFGLAFLYLLLPGPGGTRSQEPALLLLPTGILLHTSNPSPILFTGILPSHFPTARPALVSSPKTVHSKGSSHILSLPISVSQPPA